MIFKTCLFRLCPPKDNILIFRFHLFYTCECVCVLCVPLHMLCMLPTKPKRAPGPLNWSYKQLSTGSSIFCKGTSAPKHWGAPPVLQLSLKSTHIIGPGRWASNCYGQMKPAEGRVEEAACSHPFVSAYETHYWYFSVCRSQKNNDIPNIPIHSTWKLTFSSRVCPYSFTAKDHEVL